MSWNKYYYYQWEQLEFCKIKIKIEYIRRPIVFNSYSKVCKREVNGVLSNNILKIYCLNFWKAKC